MAYDSNNLIYSSPLGASRIYAYTTTDNLSDVEELELLDGRMMVYFSTPDAASKLRNGDILLVTANDGKGIYSVFSNGSGFVVQEKIASVTSFT